MGAILPPILVRTTLAHAGGIMARFKVVTPKGTSFARRGRRL